LVAREIAVAIAKKASVAKGATATRVPAKGVPAKGGNPKVGNPKGGTTKGGTAKGGTAKGSTQKSVSQKSATQNSTAKKSAMKKTAVKKTAVKKTAVKTGGVLGGAKVSGGAKKSGVTKGAAAKGGEAKSAGGNPLVPKRRDGDLTGLPPLPVVPKGVLLGTHVSSQGGSFAAPPRATEIGATALQLFTKTPNQWKEREIDAEEAALFAEALLAAGSPVTVAHDSYLINLASPDDEARARSLDSFSAELRRCAALGIDYLVSHPGNYMDDREAGIARNAAAIADALRAVPGNTILCLEATAGTGTALGATFEELAAIIALLPADLRKRVGVCVDTCHIYSAGYDIVNDFDGVIATFDRVLGLDRLKVWHLNDSKTPFNSHRDRHELIGSGSLGDAPFRRIMTDPRFAHTVKILETPKLDDATATDRTMLNRLVAFL
jgi:deoxyribonuclease IV